MVATSVARVQTVGCAVDLAYDLCGECLKSWQRVANAARRLGASGFYEQLRPTRLSHSGL